MSSRAGKVVLLMVICAILISPASPKRRKQQKQQTTQQGNFDYYLLSLSWAPNYCAEHPGDNSNECRTGNHKGFVLHGLWPQSNEGQPPMSCQSASPVAGDLVRHMLEYFPSRGMIQHEWEKHGTCSGLSSQEYFAKVEQAFKSVQPPDQLRISPVTNPFLLKILIRALLRRTTSLRTHFASHVTRRNWWELKSA
jgi:ribonuclease I